MYIKRISEFENYLNTKKKMAPSTITNYMRYIEYFLSIADSVGSRIDARQLFEVSNIETYYNLKSGSIASAVLCAFAEYLLDKKEINKHELLTFKDRIIKLKKPSSRPNSMDILSSDEIEFIISDRVHYRFSNDPNRIDHEISVVGPVIWNLALAGFEQDELIKLTMKDLDDSHIPFRIRNLYRGSDELISEWITLDKITTAKLIQYLEHRSRIDSKYENLLLFNDTPLNNNSINDTFRIFKRKDNCENFKNGGVVSAQMLVRSKLIQSLTQSNGNSLIGIIKTFGLSNAQVTYAIRNYLSK
ncbi:hypothetical protein [Paenibacillus odorifer]|uniref:hypothetical protein n=1 Tax=Paenibacillus odorifer TaxID=189426 RepID=UPI00096BE00D|nr:hypothetical protein [Paenibacillus odorifer]OMD61045.1 hypothetical protein BSK55_06815 [Paenibacillus odorifer]